MNSPGSSSLPGYAVRPPTMADLAATTALVNVVERADEGEAESTPDLLREDWEAPGFDLSLDAWLVFEASSVGEVRAAPVAYAGISPRDQHRQLVAWAMVHPEHRGRGIGWHLTDRIEGRADEHAALAPSSDPVVLFDGTVAEDTAGHRLLAERGYTPVRHFWRMAASLDGQLQPPHVSEGMELRTFVLGQDDRGVHRAIQESFAEHWGFVRRGFDEWAAHRLHEHAFDPDLWWVVEEDGEIAGVLCGKIINDVAWVDMLGVRAPWRRRGVGEALLRHSFREFRRRGSEAVKLGVDAANETGATALYERVGMHVARRFDSYQKRLR